MDSILIVDDEKLSHLTIENFLINEGFFQIDHAYTGTEALRLVEEKKNYSLILLDAIMPGENGFEIAKKIREMEIEFIPIIMMTSLTDEKSRKLAFDCKINDFITKPVDFFSLKLSIQNLLELKRLFKEQYSYHSFYENLINSISDIIIVLNSEQKGIYSNEMGHMFFEKTGLNLDTVSNILLFDDKNKKNFSLKERIIKENLFVSNKVTDSFYQKDDLFFMVSIIPSPERNELVLLFKDLSLFKKKTVQLETVIAKRNKDLQKAAYVEKTLISKKLPLCAKMLIHSLYVPSSSIGGDFHFIFSKNRIIAGMICDVSGHGVEAALYVTLLFMSVEKNKHLILESTGAFLDALDQEISHLNLSENFITALAFRVDLSANKIYYSSAGHPVPFYITPSSSEKKPFPLERGGLPLGLGFETVEPYAEYSLDFKKEDFKIIFYTDGLVEDFCNNDKMLSYKNLDQLLYSGNSSLELDLMKKSLLSLEDHPDVDDTTILMLERKKPVKITELISNESDSDHIWEKVFIYLKEFNYLEEEVKKVFVILQELISNAAKYGNGGKAEIRINSAWIVINICDNGKGFNCREYFNKSGAEKVEFFLNTKFEEYSRDKSFGVGLLMAKQASYLFFNNPTGNSFTAGVKKTNRLIECYSKFE